MVAPDLDVLDSLQCIDAGGFYNRVLLSSRGQAYTQIKCWRPSLVVICTSFEDLEGCQLLTMLTVDPATRQIPVLVQIRAEHSEDGSVDSGDSSPFWPDSLSALM